MLILFRGGGVVRFKVKAERFSLIPGSPIAYWVTEQLFDSFVKGTQLGSIAAPRQGFATGNNDRFLRLWYEVDITNNYFKASDYIHELYTGKKWFPCNKGG